MDALTPDLPPRRPPATSPRRLLRSAVVGLGLGLLLGGIAMMFLGARAWGRELDCTGRAITECALEQEIAQQVARLQFFGGVGLALLSVAMFLAVRADDRRNATSEH